MKTNLETNVDAERDNVVRESVVFQGDAMDAVDEPMIGIEVVRQRFSVGFYESRVIRGKESVGWNDEHLELSLRRPNRDAATSVAASTAESDEGGQCGRRMMLRMRG